MSCSDNVGALLQSDGLKVYVCNVATQPGETDGYDVDAHVAAIVRHLPGQTNPLDYFFEMLTALEKADDRTRFFIRVHMGNHSLFLAGVFPDRIRFRAEARGFPDLPVRWRRRWRNCGWAAWRRTR